MHDLFTTEEFARVLGITPGRVRQLKNQGVIQAVVVAGRLLFQSSQLEVARKRKSKRGPISKKKTEQ